MAGGGDDRGGICGLLDLIEEHRDALAYDWRTRFHLPLEAVPSEMGWTEAVGHVRVLRRDPSSQLVASLEGWDYPLDRLGWMLADLIDVQGSSAAGKKWKAYPRPVQPQGTAKQRGDAAGRTPEQVKELLRTRFGQPERPPV